MTQKKLFSKTHVRAILATALTLLTVGLLLNIISQNAQHSQRIAALESIVQEELATEELSSKEYLAVIEEFQSIVYTQDPQQALSALRDRMTTDSVLANSCHPIVHEIGHAAYERYGDFGGAMQFQNEICNSGYLHGVIESHFATVDNVFDELQTICDIYPSDSYLQFQCFHGVGHGMMFYTNNNLPLSLESCDSLRTKFGQGSCANGVFMENFNSDQKNHLSEYLSKDDPEYPCVEQADRHKQDCYTYAPTWWLALHQDLALSERYTQALEWCGNRAQPWSDACTFGVGSEIMKQHINTPTVVEAVCLTGSEQQIEACISGAISLAALHYGGVELLPAICDQFQDPQKQICTSTITSRTTLFD